MLLFQSTLPYGSDGLATFSAIRCFNFNPRSLTGATATSLSAFLISLISIHAPLRERPYHQNQIATGHYYFNPRSLTGATYDLSPNRCRNKNFNPRSLTGATQQAARFCLAFQFQSTLPYGSDLSGLAVCSLQRYFNPRSLTGATFLPDA